MEDQDRLDELLASAEAEEREQIAENTVNEEQEPPEDFGAPMPAEDEVARAMVGMGWDFIESSLQAKYPELVIAAGTEQKATDALTPMALKYGLGSGEMPAWLAQFMPEIRAAIFIGGFAWGIAAQVKKAKKEELKEKPRVRVPAGYNFSDVAGAAHGG